LTGRVVPESSVSEAIPILRVERLSKTFDSRRALVDARLDLGAGEVHGLVGQNGSGKSTLIKILAGFHTPDPGGGLELNGQVVPLPLSPERARNLGLSFVHQDLALFEGASVLENVRLGSFATGRGWRISWARERQVTKRLLERFELDIDPEAEVRTLSEVQRAMVALVRAIQRIPEDRPGVLILDEPTAYLPHRNVDQLFATIRRAAALGHAVLFVSHRLDEVQRITDRVTILRDGRTIASPRTASLTERELVSMILGASLDDYYPSVPDDDGQRHDVLLSARGLTASGLHQFDLDVRAGEVVGLTGLNGMPHERLPYALFGAGHGFTGSMRLGGRDVAIESLEPRHAMELGIALLPANRLQNGGVAGATVSENVTLTTLSRYVRRGVLDHAAEARAAEELLQAFEVKTSTSRARFGSLSGGNQQKALLAKWFSLSPNVFLMHEPTQGVDVGAKRQIFQQIRDSASGGAAVVVASAEYADLAHICDRVIVFTRRMGPVELRGAALTEQRIVERCYE
jgi:ribose transport system ATP-binding protein